MADVNDLTPGAALQKKSPLQPGHGALRTIDRRGRHLGNRYGLGSLVVCDAVGECATDVRCTRMRLLIHRFVTITFPLP